MRIPDPYPIGDLFADPAFQEHSYAQLHAGGYVARVDGMDVLLVFPYDETLNQELRGIRGAWWDETSRAWRATVKPSNVRLLHGFLRRNGFTFRLELHNLLAAIAQEAP